MHTSDLLFICCFGQQHFIFGFGQPFESWIADQKYDKNAEQNNEYANPVHHDAFGCLFRVIVFAINIEQEDVEMSRSYVLFFKQKLKLLFQSEASCHCSIWTTEWVRIAGSVWPDPVVRANPVYLQSQLKMFCVQKPKTVLSENFVPAFFFRGDTFFCLKTWVQGPAAA